MAEVLVIGGRVFSPAATLTTFAQDGYLRGVLVQHDLARVIEAGGDVYDAVCVAGCESALIAGLVVADDGRWSRDAAVRNAAFFDTLTAPEDKAKLLAVLARFLSDFFVPGGSSSPASPTSSTTPAGASRRPRPKRRRPPVTPPASDTASGSMSSPPSVSSTASA